MPKRLLIVDDEPANLVLVERHLNQPGYDLVQAHDGPSALERFREEGPDLVLLDVAMPGMSGLDVLAEIRANEGTDHVPVILVTAHSEREHRRHGLEAGADEFLEKPVDGAILRSRVKTLLQLKESRDALRSLNDELATRNTALERLQREQRELMGFIVHDLKNPLSVVWSSVEFAQSELHGESSMLTDALKDASDASRRLRSMINDLLTISRLEEADLPLRLELVSLSELLGEVLREYARRAEAKNVELLTPARLSASVTADRTLLQRVIENILDNSLRYTPEHGRVSVAMRESDHVEIAVSNNGPSIPPSQRARIFDKFARLEGASVARGNAGLGLYFCKRAVESLGGRIEVTEAPEWPTSFVVHLPAPVGPS
ncbi:MAG: hybrid sensor histidine kinase/response regulator [Myxococcales bacterium]|nr:hybrid sensor histidine kinase/response regulator [Myxococcales bacterium]